MRRNEGNARRNAARTPSPRDRILSAARAAFTERGFAATSTLEIATRAKVSKRELYALFGSKQQMLVTCIAEHAGRLRLPTSLRAPRDRQELEASLVEFGSLLLRGLSDPRVVALHRLAVSEADRSPEIGHALDVYGRRAVEVALREMLEAARSARLLADADVETLANQFMSLLLDDLPMSLALGLRKRPGHDEIARRATGAARAVLGLAGSA